MAINPEAQYAGKIAPSTAEYPYGQARNITVPGDGTGTPLDSAWLNDVFGYEQALLAAANIVPTGSPETAEASQFLEAHRRISGSIIPSMADGLFGFTGVSGQEIMALSWSDQEDKGLAVLRWNATLARSNHDGAVYFSPTVPKLSDQAGATYDDRRDNYRLATGETAPGSNGLWEKVDVIRSVNSYGMAENATSGAPVRPAIAETPVFIDTLRQLNFHTPGADVNEYSFLVPDEKFRITEASRSLEKPIGPLNRVLFVGDSLTAYVATDGSYANRVSQTLADLKGGVREVGYLAAEGNDVSAKQQFFGVTIAQSGFSYLNIGGFDYTDDVRRFSPDGKGATITGADGLRFYHWEVNSSDTVRYTKYRLYYLQQPGGGTFDIRNRGATLNPVNTSGTLGLQTVEFDFVPLGSPLNKDIRVENVTGDVTIYGVELIDEEVSSGYSYDVFAVSGGALFELLQLEASSVQTLLTSRGCDTVVINIGTNDSTQGRTPAQFIADLTAYLGRLQTALPDVEFVIVTPNNMQFTNFTGSTRALYENERRKYCRENNLMYIDLPSEVGNFNYFASLGWMRDGTHPNVLGQNVIGMKVAEKLINNMAVPVDNPPEPLAIPDTGVQAYATFHAEAGTLTVLNEVGCTLTRLGVGLYQGQFPEDLADAFYTVAVENSAGDRIMAALGSNRSATTFRLQHTDLSGTPVDVASATPTSFSIIGRRTPRL